MFILTINPGSDSLKYALFKSVGKKLTEVMNDTLRSSQKLNIPLLEKSEVIAIRIVHGGTFFYEPTLVTDPVLAKLETLVPLAPLHNSVSIKYIKDLKKQFPDKPIVAVFDTEFHQTMPQKAKMYGLPKDISKKYGIQHFGFHGLAHEWMLEEYARLKKKKKNTCNLITVQLGSGCSLCVMRNGKSVDTSMGFSPLEGPIMRTRSGSLDPNIVLHLIEQGGLKPAKIRNILYRDSGLKGIAGNQGRIKAILEASVTNKDAKMALEKFVYDIQKIIGSYLTVLPKIDAIVFSGGIAGHEAEVIEMIVKPLRHLGIGTDVKSPVQVIRVPMNEEMIMARKVAGIGNLKI